MVNQDDELLTVREVARRCNRSEETVRRWIWSGKLPARKLGNQLFVEAANVAIESSKATGHSGLLFEPVRRLTDKEFRELESRERALREKLFRRHGNFDTAELVRESREGH
jgi:excisionase family DNA binding protein